MINLKGSVKQIKWASDIRFKMLGYVDFWKDCVNEADYKTEEVRQKAINQLENVKKYLNDMESASEVIERFKEFNIREMSELSREINGKSSIARAMDIVHEKTLIIEE